MRRAAAGRRTRRWPLLVAAAAVVAGACAQVGTDPNAPVELAFDSLPLNAVARGFSTVDSLGQPVPTLAPLVKVYNFAGKPIPNPTVRFYRVDTGSVTLGNVSVDSLTGVVKAGPTVTVPSVRMVASVGGLQSVPQVVFVVTRPTVVADTGAPVDTVATGTPPALAALAPFAAATTRCPVDTLVTTPFTAVVLGDSAGTRVPVPGWYVRFDIVPPHRAAGDTARHFIDTAYVLAPNGRDADPYARTSASGTATAAVRIIHTPPTRADSASAPAVADTLIVRATAYGPDGTVLQAPNPLRVRLRYFMTCGS